MSAHKGRFRLSDMEFDFVSLVPAGDDPMAQVVIAKADPSDKSTSAPVPGSTLPASHDPVEDNMGEQIAKDDLAPEVVAYIDSLEAENETLAAQVEKAESDLSERDTEIESLRDTLSKSAPKDEESAEAIQKALLEKADPAVRSLIEKAQADAREAERIAKAEREARLEREYIAKAEQMPMLTEDKSALAGLLRRMADSLSTEDSAAVEKMLRAANEQIAKSSLFDTFGRGGGETTISKAVDARVDEVLKAEPNLTRAQAEAKVYDENPDLLAQAMTGQEG